ncbi:non-ribosomal peptide synthetase [Echinicola strongylocentroti]|uniref:Non-ribosomal peptide synthetase n=1 Tax=Echinicola strongylocentroti TaxID=1795355 RepID=A0A2Z4IL97_9BACT|nr:non-ribosomal peptide synthetase [Echinicola strongylocentroti]AWW31715.1 non-ribosomal peptide synthetase [Echinicola strongylocentroti]
MKQLLDYEFKQVDFDPFETTALERVFAPIASQKEIWLACQIGGKEANKSYNQSISLLFRGAFSEQHFIRAIHELVVRHEALRATFSKDGKSIFIQEHLQPELITKDIASLTKSDQEAYLKNFLQENVNTAFDLENGPLFRLAIHRLGEKEYHFTFTIHHIIGDGWSLGVILEELSKLYNNELSYSPTYLAKANSLGTYCEAIHKRENTQEQRSTEQFWLDKFKDVSKDFKIPTDYPRPEIKSYKSARLDFNIPSEQINKIKQLGLQHNVSMVNTFIIAFEVFLSKKYRSNEVVLGVPAAGQPAMGHFNLIGHCVNLLPLPSRFSPDDTFLQHLKQRNEFILDCYDHQLLTYSSLLNKLNLKRDLSSTTLVPVVLNLDLGMDSNVAFDNLDFELISNPRAYDNFEIALNLTNNKDHCRFEWSYNTTLFKKESIVSMMEEFSYLLDSVTQSPELRISEISLRDKNEVLEFYRSWNKTTLEVPQKGSFADILHESAVRYSQKTAVEFQQQKLTYAELDELSNQFADFIRKQNINKGDRVGLFLPRSAELIMALIGTIKSGAVYIPIDPSLPKERIKHMLEDSAAKAIITSRDLLGEVPEDISHLVMETFMDNPSVYSSTYQEVGLTQNDPLYLLYTSGSTGLPKGVLVSHQNLINFYYSAKDIFNVSESDRTLAITTISFDVAGMEIVATLGNGATLVVADTPTQKDGRLLLKALKEKYITRVFSTPATYQMLLQVGWESHLPLKIVSGGEPFSQKLIEQLLPITDEIWNAYGPTETTIFSTIKLIDKPEAYNSIGKPIHNTQIYLLDEHQQPVSPGEIGEIYIGGKGVALGYWQRPELNKERFINNPFDSTHPKLYKTGDLGQINSNEELICLGRIDTQVKIRGHRIELGEIEQQINLIDGLTASHVSIIQGTAGPKHLIAYIIRKNQSAERPPNDETLLWKSFLQRSLPDYMVPVEWVALTHFPLTPNGKIDQKALPVPTFEAKEHKASDRSSWSENEMLVSEIWQDKLKLPFIDLDDDFFELGGHSILAVEVMSTLDKKIDAQLPLTTIFKHATVRGFAAILDNKNQTQAQNKEWSSLLPIKPSGHKAPIYMVHGVAANITNYFKLIDHVDKDQPLYGLQAKGLNGTDSPNIGMENIAAHYVNEIIEHNPEGPYHIGGYSFGGYVAFEMAKQLIKRNKKMGKLIIFDTSIDQETAISSGFLEKAAKEFQKRKVEMQLLVNAPQTFRITKGRMIKRKAEEILIKMGIQKEKDPMDRAAIIKKIKKINTDAIENYKLAPIDMDLVLFKAKIKLTAVQDAEFYGWSSYANSVKVIDVDGDHNSMFDPPFVKPFAQKLQSLLNSDL